MFPDVPPAPAAGNAGISDTADDQTKIYDGQPFAAFTAHFAGFVNGENATTAGVRGAASFSGSATSAVAPGSYAIVPGLGTLAADNYAFQTFTNGTLVIIGLTVTSSQRTDGRYQLDAYHATPGGVVVFCYGTLLGTNPSPQFGVTLGLTDPVYVAQGGAGRERTRRLATEEILEQSRIRRGSTRRACGSADPRGSPAR